MFSLLTYRRNDFSTGGGVPLFVPVVRLCFGQRTYCGVLMVLMLILLMPVFTLAVPPGTVISNAAQGTYDAGSVSGIVLQSNTVTIVTVDFRTPSALEFLQYAPTAPGAEFIMVSITDYSTSGTPAGPFVPLPPPTPVGSGVPIDLSNPVPLVVTSLFHKGEPVFVRLTDADQNLDPLAGETVVVTLSVSSLGEGEFLRITETGPDTGIFIGYIQSGANPPTAMGNDGTLTVVEGSDITGDYVDVVDGSDSAASTAMVDPFGIVFDSTTGQPVDGATVTLIDTATGAPALVVGDDGVSSFPATITSGGTVTDSGGTVYNFPSGGYRFPLVSPGDYRLEVVPPTGYAAPSTVPMATLQSLPGGPFAIVDPGSRGEPFVLNPGPAFRIDIPIDATASRLWLRKTASKDTVGVGDFLQYNLNLENFTGAELSGVIVRDRLPSGFRLESGSAKVDGVTSAKPTISSDGRTLTFNLGALAESSTVNIRYVVEVAAGAKLGKAINQAQARNDNGLTSNIASATVSVTEDFFRTRTFIVGRVIADNCSDAEVDESDGIKGVRIFLEDGTYVITDEHGMYHIEGVRPGAHVVQLDLDSLPQKYEVVPCEMNSRFAGRSYSQFVDLQGGTMWRADFHVGLKPKLKDEVSLEITSELKDGFIIFGVHLQGGKVPLRNLRLTIMLPDGSMYVSNSSTLNDNSLPDPTVTSNTLTYRLGDVADEWVKALRFKAKIASKGDSRELLTKGVLIFDTPKKKNQRTPLVDNVLLRITATDVKDQPEIVLYPKFDSFSAQLNRKDKDMLDRFVMDLKDLKVNHIEVTGHSDAVPIREQSMHIYADNYTLSEARAHRVGRYLTEALNLAPSQVTVRGKGPDEPMAGNATAEARAMNGRVTVRIITQKVDRHTAFQMLKDRDRVRVETTGLRPGEKWETTQADKKIPKAAPDYDNAWLEAAKPGLEWLSPETDHNPPIPSLKLAIKHHPKDKLQLLLDGEEVNPLNFEGMSKNKAGTAAVSRWTGVDLHEGDNHFELILFDGNGNEKGRLQRMVHYSGPPVHAEVVKEKCNLVANGKETPLIAVRLTDKDGYPAREDVIGEFTVDPPYTSYQEIEAFQKNPLSGLNKNKPHYTIGKDGIALIKLQATSQTGEAVVKFYFNQGDQELRIWLQPEERDWILVGLAEGTVGYNTVSGNMQNLADADVDDKYYDDGRVAFFAKGKIKGKWLLTLAYDTEKQTVGDGLFQTINPDTYYTIYGDGSQQNYEAASTKKVYVKIERDQFYAMFGDYNTGLTATELSRYSRSLTGLKSELHKNNYGYNLFVSDTDQAFVRDEIRGDGTSGLYRLSQKNIVINSEKVVIETRDRFRSEVIDSSQNLSRFIDYNIDYDEGTLYFKEPIYSKDENLNPIFIVVDYETDNSANDYYNYGGRGVVKFFDQKAEVGATYVHEDQVSTDGDLYGLDATFSIGKNTQLRAEAATTRTENFGDDEKGNAYLVELAHRSGKLDGSLYAREQQEDFGLGQQNGSESGTRKLGGEASYRFTQDMSVGVLAYRQYNLVTDAKRDVAEASVKYRKDRFSLRSGFLHANDHLGDGSNRTSNQITAGGGLFFFDKRLQLRADQALSLWDNENVDFPTRTVLGADYKLSDSVTLFAEQEFTFSDSTQDTFGTRLGMKATPWSGGQVGTSVGQDYNENGARVFANLGLKQTWQIDEKWSVDGGFDSSWTARNSGFYIFNTNVPPASGEKDDFAAVSLGTTYRAAKWSWTWRGEYRDSETEDKWGLYSGIYGEPREGLGLSAGIQIFRTEAEAGADTTDGNIRLGLAYRPRNTSWIVLDRLDFIFEEEESRDFDFDNWRIVNNLNANYKLNWKTQIAFQYGTKYVQDTIDGDQYRGFTDLVGIEARYDLTEKWDIGVRGSVLHSWNADQFDYGTGVSLGYNIVQNTWVSVGYNFLGFEDEDFSKGSFTAKGPFVQFRFKFDQQSVRDMVSRWASK